MSLPHTMPFTFCRPNASRDKTAISVIDLPSHDGPRGARAAAAAQLQRSLEETIETKTQRGPLLPVEASMHTPQP